MKFYVEQMNVKHKVHYQQNVCIYYAMPLHVSTILWPSSGGYKFVRRRQRIRQRVVDYWQSSVTVCHIRRARR